jgi:hypothetical protein
LYEEGERGFRRSELFRAFEECGFANVKSRPHGFVAYTLIGNTNVLPLFAGLRNRTLIDAMIGMDRAFSKIPIVHRFALAVLIRGQVMK